MKSAITLITSAIILSGCGSYGHVKNSFPDLPPKLMEKPVPMVTISKVNPDELNNPSPSNIPLSSVLRTITTNYGICNTYVEQINSLQLWLIEQKRVNP